MMLADFNPGMLLLLLWGLISWLTRKKKKKIDTDSNEVITKPKEDLFARLQKLQEQLREPQERLQLGCRERQRLEQLQRQRLEQLERQRLEQQDRQRLEQQERQRLEQQER